MQISGLVGHPSGSPGQGMDVVDRTPTALTAVKGQVPVRAVAVAGRGGREHGLGAPAFGVLEALTPATPTGLGRDAMAGPVGVACKATAFEVGTTTVALAVVVDAAEAAAGRRRRLGPTEAAGSRRRRQRRQTRHLIKLGTATKATAAVTAWRQNYVTFGLKMDE